jgi:transcriptional regulator with XRE-family HTH domain
VNGLTVGGSEGARVNIGVRLRENRKRLNLTLDEVAQRTGLTKGFISEVERDLVSPSLVSLLAICDALGMKVGELFSANNSALVRADQRPKILLSGDGVRDYLLSASVRSRLQAILTELDAGATSSTELYSLPSDEAFAMVMDGQVVIRVGDRTFDMGVGDALTFDPHVPHTFWNPSDTQRACILFVNAPPSF